MKKSVLVAVLSALVVGGGSILSTVTASAETVAVATMELTHSHVGSESSSGGCYTNKTSYSYNETCKGYSGAAWQQNGAGQWYVTCTTCGTYWAVSGNCSYQKCSHQTTKTGTKYTLSCGVTAGDAVGMFTISKEAGRTSYYLKPSVSTSSSVCVPVSYTWSNGDTGTCTVTGNGSYTCTLKWTDMGVEKTATLSYVVTDYDTEPPVIESVTGYESREKYHTIVVSATDNYGVTGYMIEKK